MVAAKPRPRWQTLGYTRADLETAIHTTQEAFAQGLQQASVVDIAFIGNTGAAYRWEPAMVMDIDICIFTTALSPPVGVWLFDVAARLKQDLATHGIDFELRVVKGPYKPDASKLLRPIAVAHVALFTLDGFAATSPCLRWSWKKYACLSQADRLRGYAPDALQVDDVIDLIETKLAVVERGHVELEERLLPSLALRIHRYEAASHIFGEYCVNAVALCARNHGRLRGCHEADTLENRDYFAWYTQEVYRSHAFVRLMNLKLKARNIGYRGHLAARDAAQFLVEIRRQLRSAVV